MINSTETELSEYLIYLKNDEVPVTLVRLHLDVRGIPREVSDLEEGFINVPDEIIVYWEFIGLFLNDNRFAIGLDLFDHQAQTGSPCVPGPRK